MKRKMIMMLLSVTVGLALIAGATWAWFTDDADTGEVAFTAGTLDINIADGAFQAILADNIGNMNPGDVYEPIEITITNDGTKNLAWFGNWEITGGETPYELINLQQALYIHYAKMEFLTPGGGTWEPMDNFIANGVGAGAWPDWFNTLASLNKFGVVGLDVWDDNNGMGTTPYEHMGALKPGYSYRLTVQFGFHKDADNYYQGIEGTNPVTIKFSVKATQVHEDAINDEIMAGYGTNHINWLRAQIAKQP